MRHRDGGEERREGEPHLEGGPREDQWGCLVAPQRVRDEAATLEQVAGGRDVVGGVLGLGEDDLDGEHGPHHEGDQEDQPRATTGPRDGSWRESLVTG